MWQLFFGDIRGWAVSCPQAQFSCKHWQRWDPLFLFVKQEPPMPAMTSLGSTERLLNHTTHTHTQMYAGIQKLYRNIILTSAVHVICVTLVSYHSRRFFFTSEKSAVDIKS